MADTHMPAARVTLPPLRPEYLCETIASADIGVVQQPLTVWQRLANQGWLRKTFILGAIAAGWQLYAMHLNNPLLVPTFTATLEAFNAGVVSGDIPEKVVNSVILLLKGYVIGLALAMVLHRARDDVAARQRPPGDADLGLQPAAGDRACCRSR